MIFIIPFLLGGAALASAAYGAIKGKEGFSNIGKARQIGENAQNKYENAVEGVKREWKEIQTLAEEYGQLQLDVKRKTIGRFVYFLEKIGKKNKQNKQYLEGLEGFSPQQFQEYKTAVLEAENIANGGFKAIGAGAAAGQGAVGLIGLFGTASTGTAISGLSGAAAWNATLAWLGGGSLAAGGGGMALGWVVLSGIYAGPVLAIGGFVVAGQGEKALTQAREYQAKVNTKIAELEASKDFMGQVQRRINELGTLLIDLNDRAVTAIDQLDPNSFDFNRDGYKFQQAGLLVKSLAEIMKTPVLDSQGNLNPATANIRAKISSFGV